MEIIPVVDKKNNVIGLENRKIVHEKGMLHRGVHIIIFNSKGEILLQRRSAKKDICPLLWDLSVAEHIKPDESYDAAAKRGIREELGIKNMKLEMVRGMHLDKNDYERNLKDYEFVELYKGTFVELHAGKYDGKIKIDPEEVKEAGFYPMSKVEELKKEGKLTPWFLDEWNWIKKNGIVH